MKKIEGKMVTVYISPFDSICDTWAIKCDETIILGDSEKIKEIICELKAFLENHDEPAYAPLFYAVGNLITELCVKFISESKNNNPYTDSGFVKKHGNALWYYRHAEFLLDRIEKKEEFLPYLIGVYSILYVNHANALEQCGRKCSAIDYYGKALSVNPKFGMALGNIARCLQHYALLEGDSGHREVLLKEAFKYNERALNNIDQNTTVEAQAYFEKNYKKLLLKFGEDWFKNPIEYIVNPIKSKREADYREWCLANHLFLNSLNDLPESNVAYASDPLHISSIMVSIEKAEIPFVVEMFNQIKEEFVYARLLLYEVGDYKQKVHFADKETHIIDTLNYCSYSIRLEKLKTTYRTLYSLFDRIAFLLNAYLKLGIKERDVSFDRIFENSNLLNTEINNIAIQALHWIERDFKEKFEDADTAHTKNLRILRNAMEHKFVSIQLFSPENEDIKIGEDNIYHVSEDQLTGYTMDLIKLVREAIIELIVAIRIEEQKRHMNGDKIMSLTMPEYEDKCKR